MSGPDCEQLTLFPADSHASHLVLPGSEEARKMTATSGLRCLELYRKSGPLGSLVRMLVGSSEWVSTRRYLTWKPQATKQGRLYFRLVPLTPPTDVIDARLWPTQNRCKASMDVNLTLSGDGREKSNKLGWAVSMWPTPSATDAGRTKINPHMTKNGTVRHIGKTGGKSYARLDQVVALQEKESGTLNPDWVEWLMAFPPGWTDIG